MSSQKQHAPKATAQAKDNPLLTAALQYASGGWAVFPLVSRTKVPFKGTHGFKDASMDPATICAWWAKWPDANIGIATGEASNLTVLDTDPRNGGHLTLDALIAEHGVLPATATVITGSGGRHLYFNHTFTLARGSNALGPGVDLKSDGGFIIAPPSLHPNGTPYRWEPADQEPGDLPFWVVTMDRPERSTKINGGGDRDGTRSSTSSSCTIPPNHLFRGEKPDAECAQALDLPLEGKFSCVLHSPDLHPSAWLFVGNGGDLHYHCEHEGGWTLTLPQVRASLAYGRITQIRDENGKAQPVEHLAWRLRLLYEAGSVQPLEVPHRPLDGEARPAVRAVYNGLLLLLGLKWHLWPGNGTTFSWRFAAAWCDVDKKTAEKAMRWLMEAGYVRSVGTSRGAYGKVAHVLMPSPEKPESRVKRTRKEWAIYRAEQRELEALYWAEYEEAEASGELADLMERDDELYDEDWNLREPYASMIAALDAGGTEGWL